MILERTDSRIGRIELREMAEAEATRMAEAEAKGMPDFWVKAYINGFVRGYIKGYIKGQIEILQDLVADGDLSKERALVRLQHLHEQQLINDEQWATAQQTLSQAP